MVHEYLEFDPTVEGQNADDFEDDFADEECPVCSGLGVVDAGLRFIICERCEGTGTLL